MAFLYAILMPGEGPHRATAADTQACVGTVLRHIGSCWTLVTSQHLAGGTVNMVVFASVWTLFLLATAPRSPATLSLGFGDLENVPGQVAVRMWIIHVSHDEEAPVGSLRINRVSSSCSKLKACNNPDPEIGIWGHVTCHKSDISNWWR